MSFSASTSRLAAAPSARGGAMMPPEAPPSFGNIALPGIVCAHCGDIVPTGRTSPQGELSFCCDGCEAAHRLIHEAGLVGYYEAARRLGAEMPKGRDTKIDFGVFDDIAVWNACGAPAAGGDGTWVVDLALDNVHCAACIWLVEKLPLTIPGIRRAELDVGRAIARIEFHPGEGKLSHAVRFLDQLGYPCRPYKRAEAAERAKERTRERLVRLGVAGAIAANAMLLALALYAGLFDTMDGSDSELFRWLSLIVAFPAVTWAGADFHRHAWNGLKAGIPTMDLPISVGIIAGTLAGTINTIRGTGEIYFDSLAVLVFLLLGGRHLQAVAQEAAQAQVERLLTVTPHLAKRVQPDGTVTEVSVEALRPGDIVRVDPGAIVPGDGIVEHGESDLDMSVLTGETVPVATRPGEPVPAGAQVVSHPLRVKITERGDDTRAAKLMAMVEGFAARRAPTVREADSLARIFVVVVLALAAGTGIVWSFIDPTHALEYATAMLVVTCPCALALATPLAVTVALGRAARLGLLVKGGDALESLAKPGRLFLDKTGTLTEGRMEVSQMWGDAEVGSAVAALESHSSHPIAKAIVRRLGDGTGHVVTGVRAVAGGGLAGKVDDWHFVVGSPAFLAAEGVKGVDALSALDAAVAHGATPVGVGRDGQLVMALALTDPVRGEAPELIADLKRMGFRPEIWSGDDPRAVAACAATLGIESVRAHGGKKPEDKFEAVKAALGSGPVVMIGDGVNDAAALRAATVGVAVAGASESSWEAADVVLTRPGLAAIRDLVLGAKRSLGIIRRAMIVSLSYNALAATLTALGLIHPLLAAVIMPVSSLSVLAIAVYSRSFEKAL